MCQGYYSFYIFISFYFNLVFTFYFSLVLISLTSDYEF